MHLTVLTLSRDPHCVFVTVAWTCSSHVASRVETQSLVASSVRACATFGWWSAAVLETTGLTTAPSVVKLVKVQELAASQGAHGMEGAASAGHAGRQPKNLYRGMMTLFGTPLGAPAFSWLRPVRNGPDFHPVLLPHVFFSELFEHRRSVWKESIRGPLGAAREFWQRLQHWAVVRDRPHLPRARWTKTVPMGLHCDAFSRSRTVHLSFLRTH